MPSFNESTGARIASGVHVKGTDKEKFAKGWDLLWGSGAKKTEEEILTAEENHCASGECKHCE